MVKNPGFPFTLTGCTTTRCKFSLWPSNTIAMILMSEPLGGRWIAPCDERAIAHAFVGLTVHKRSS